MSNPYPEHMTDEQRLQMITDQLILVRDNLFRGMSKSIQKLQARNINEVLELENFTRSPQPATRPATREEKIVNPGVYEIVQRAEDSFESAKQREWVGLTDEEILEALDLVAYDTQAFEQAYAIEAKLKEKNHYG